jgi:hypothetical protein
VSNGINIHDSVDWMGDSVVNALEVCLVFVNIVKVFILQKSGLVFIQIDSLLDEAFVEKERVDITLTHVLKICLTLSLIEIKDVLV